MSTILIVDDDPKIRTILARLVSTHGHTVSQAESAAEAVSAIRLAPPDLVITDMEMPGGTGFVVLEAGLSARVPVVILTAHGSVEMAVDAMRRGAANFLSKPFSADSVAQVLQESFTGRTPRSMPAIAAIATLPAIQAIPGTSPVATPYTKSASDRPVGVDEAFTSVLGIAERVADTDATILITGESGTGKEVIARAIHAASARRHRAFVPVNCGAIPDGLLESELFGHVRGAFTGATQMRRGRFQLAEGGTLFLDEIGDMPPVLQVKLLRVLQDRVFEVLGDSRPQPANVRFVAATHRNLESLVAGGTFREDLYYRLNVVPLHLPPLRERPRDIPLLIAHFVAEANAAYNRTVTGISEDALEALSHCVWPGNIRELGNLVERMTVMRGHGRIELSDVPDTLRRRKELYPPNQDLPLCGMDLTEAVLNFEVVMISKALERTKGNKTQAAGLLRINRTTLVEKLKRREGGGLVEAEEGG